MKNVTLAAIAALSLTSASVQAQNIALDIPSFSNEEYDAARKLDWNDPEDRKSIMILLGAITGTIGITSALSGGAVGGFCVAGTILTIPSGGTFVC